MIVLAFVGTFVVGAIAEGWILSVMWGWFFVPLGAPRLSVAAAIGVAMVVGLLTHQNDYGDHELSTVLTHCILKLIISYPLILFAGWITSKFL